MTDDALVEQIAPLVHDVLSNANVMAYLDMPHETPNDVASALLPLIHAREIAVARAMQEACAVFVFESWDGGEPYAGLNKRIRALDPNAIVKGMGDVRGEG